MDILRSHYPDISDLLEPLEGAIRLHLIPALTGRESISDIERDLFSLPTRLGGLGIIKSMEIAALEFSSSQKITAPLAALVLLQQPEISLETMHDQQQAKAEVRQIRRQQYTDRATELKTKLPRHLCRAVELGSEKGASSWLSALPLKSMDSHSIRGHFEMHYAFVTTGSHLTYPETACVVNPLLWNMLSTATQEDSQQWRSWVIISGGALHLQA